MAKPYKLTPIEHILSSVERCGDNLSNKVNLTVSDKQKTSQNFGTSQASAITPAEGSLLSKNVPRKSSQGSFKQKWKILKPFLSSQKDYARGKRYFFATS